MPIIVFQHSDISTPGRLGLTLRDHGLALDIRRLDKVSGAVPKDLDDVDGLIILGGPMNVTDIASLAWMQAESEFIKRCHEAQLPVIGICLGAQLIAHSLGGTVAPKSTPEVGFRATSITIPGQTETILAGITWNSQQFYACEQEITALPPGATLLASSKGTKNAAYKFGLRTFGFIYHFECDRPGVDAILNSSAGLANKMGLSPADLASQVDQSYPGFARLSDRLCLNIAQTCFPLQRRMRA